MKQYISLYEQFINESNQDIEISNKIIDIANLNAFGSGYPNIENYNYSLNGFEEGITKNQDVIKFALKNNIEKIAKDIINIGSIKEIDKSLDYLVKKAKSSNKKYAYIFKAIFSTYDPQTANLLVTDFDLSKFNIKYDKKFETKKLTSEDLDYIEE